MSTLPLNRDPSASTTRAAVMSPSSEPVIVISTLSVARTLPITLPSTITELAQISAVTEPVRPIVTLQSSIVILPSTVPSIVMSSWPLSSPWICTDSPMLAG